MSEEYEKKVRFAGINPEAPAIAAKSKKRWEGRKEREKEAAALSKKRKAAKKAAYAKSPAQPSADNTPADDIKDRG